MPQRYIRYVNGAVHSNWEQGRWSFHLELNPRNWGVGIQLDATDPTVTFIVMLGPAHFEVARRGE